MLKTTTLGLALLLALSACQDGQYAASTRHLAPIPPATLALMSTKGVSAADPILMRAYKKESEIELWKRGADGQPRTKRLLQVRGQTQFLVSADSSRAVVLQEDLATGHYKLTALDGEKGLDPSDATLPNAFELPCPKLTVAFWLSPDSTKVLLLTAASKTVDEAVTQRGQARLPINSDMQWSVYNFPLDEVREYEAFKPTPYFMKVRLCVLLLFLARALLFFS